MKTTLRLFHVLLGLLAVRGAAQSPMFTYQGRLDEGGTPATGLYELRFTLRDAASGGGAVAGAPVLTQAVGVTNGHFTAALNFGTAAFDGAARWLEIAVRPNGSIQAHSVLAPAQPLTAAPYAVRSASAAAYSGAVSDGQLSANVARLDAAQTFSSTVTFAPVSGAPFAVNSTNRVTNLNADLLDGWSASAFWNLNGNASTGATNFLGTPDNQPLQFRVNNTRALRLEPTTGTPNLIGGFSNNFVAAGTVGATIGGGGATGFSNRVAAAYGTVAGGLGNAVLANDAFVGGGIGNTVHSTSDRAVIVGGRDNNVQTNADYAVLAGGELNVVATNATHAMLGGGVTNLAGGSLDVVAGGGGNTARGVASSIGGGFANSAIANYATVPGGYSNSASGQFSFAAGRLARAQHDGVFAWADNSLATAFASTAVNQFLIRAAGGVGIGGAPQDSLLDVEGLVRVNDFDLLLRGGVDRNHGLGWYGTGKAFAGLSLDGPVLYGWAGGGLGSLQGGARLGLRWNSTGDVGIGTATPGVRLDVAGTAQTIARFESSNLGGTWLALRNTSTGGGTWNLISSGVSNGEGAGDLLFFGGGSTKVMFQSDGRVGIGSIEPRDLLEVRGADATLRIVNGNDQSGNLGGYIGNTFATLQLGMFNDTAGTIGAIPAGTKRSFFGMNSSGQVGSLNNQYGSPTWRNILDDGSGHMRVNTAGTLNFGTATRQMVNLWNANYGVGVQNNTLYFRTDGNVAWYRLGSHSDTAYDPGGGGSTLMKLDSGGLTVNGTFFSTSDRAAKQDFAPVKPSDVLDRLATVPIQKWRFKENPGVEHIGPMAQDFHTAFGVGPDDRHISMTDADGVALAAIQGLHEKVQEQAAEIRQLKDAVAQLTHLLREAAEKQR